MRIKWYQILSDEGALFLMLFCMFFRMKSRPVENLSSYGTAEVKMID